MSNTQGTYVIEKADLRSSVKRVVQWLGPDNPEGPSLDDVRAWGSPDAFVSTVEEYNKDYALDPTDAEEFVEGTLIVAYPACHANAHFIIYPGEWMLVQRGCPVEGVGLDWINSSTVPVNALTTECIDSLIEQWSQLDAQAALLGDN